AVLARTRVPGTPRFPSQPLIACLDDRVQETGDDHHAQAHDHEHESDGSEHCWVSSPSLVAVTDSRVERRPVPAPPRNRSGLPTRSPYLGYRAHPRRVPAATCVVTVTSAGGPAPATGPPRRCPDPRAPTAEAAPWDCPPSPVRAPANPPGSAVRSPSRRCSANSLLVCLEVISFGFSVAWHHVDG